MALNIKLIALGATGTLTAIGATLGYFFSNSDSGINHNGKSLKSKYPKLVVPEYGGTDGKIYFDNTFWREKTKILLEYVSKPYWDKLLDSIERGLKSLSIGFGSTDIKKALSINDSAKEFHIGNSQVAEKLANYCKYIKDKEDSAIPNFPDVIKDLCTK